MQKKELIENDNVATFDTEEYKEQAEQLQKELIKKKARSQFQAPRPELSRKERRQLAKKHGYEFTPLYNDPDGLQTYEEYHGVGYERFEKIPKKRKQEQ